MSDKRKVKIDPSYLELVFESGFECYLDVENGEIVMPDSEESNITREDVEDNDRYIPIPSQNSHAG